MVIYLEGDGRAFISRTRPSGDPTPYNPVAMKVASKDPGPAVLYIARPCQYIRQTNSRNCNMSDWTTHRYSPEIVSAVNQVIDYYKIKHGIVTVGLVGFSGGGAIAILAASSRTDVQWLVTLAGNLDVGKWTKYHRLTPLSGSLDPAYYASKITHIPQWHLVGSDDEVVPAEISSSYITHADVHSNIKITLIPGYNHNCCWHKQWPQLACEAGVIRHPYCQQQ